MGIQEVLFFFYLDRGTVMAVWTINVILFFETDVLKILYWWSSTHTHTHTQHGNSFTLYNDSR